MPALLLPDGRLRSRRWRVVVATSAAGATLAVVAGSLTPARLESTPMNNPFGLPGPVGTAALVLAIIGVLLHWASLPAAAVCVVLRFRASSGVQRQQLRWVAVGAAGAVAGLLLTLPSWAGIWPNAQRCCRPKTRASRPDPRAVCWCVTHMTQGCNTRPPCRNAE